MCIYCSNIILLVFVHFTKNGTLRDHSLFMAGGGQVRMRGGGIQILGNLRGGGGLKICQ